MTAPIRYHSVTSDGHLLVTAGKNPSLRTINLTREEAASIIAALARELAKEEA